MFPEGFDMADLMAQAQALQTQMQQTTQQLRATSFVGTAGGDPVRATLNGAGDLLDLHIEPAAIDPDDPEGLADLIIAAVRAAKQRADDAMKSALPDMPDLSALGL
jgi:DNA-binding YbaB/EbfC family protein